MNRIPIISLLNPSPNDVHSIRQPLMAGSSYGLKKDAYEAETLLKMRNELLKLHTTICCTNTGNKEVNDILNQVLQGLKTLSSDQVFSKPDRVVIQNISQLTTIIVRLVNKKEDLINLQKELAGSKELSDATSKDKCGIIFNVVTQDMMENGRKGGCSSYKGHRLPKQHVQVLEAWYKNNIENPYLNDTDIRYLMRETGFSRSQVKNWVANKRRKDKHSTISPELSDLLAN
ncbi:FAFR750C-Xp [Eremothecium gossypii FDAG1]|nr:FAFR750C-Xp [Eremothecium gossypii FDAG1]